uniref:Immunoglobulin I-set domain-containing protein n=1 Tax=Megaselia scalaris TaxID=36166 RepID=T1H1D2_MEGSC
MKLQIRNVVSADFGSYRCVAKNSLGETDGIIKLDEIPMPTSTEGNNISNLNNELNKSTDLTNRMDQKPTMIRKPNNVYVNSGETSISKKYSFFTIYISYMLINLCYYTLFSF